MVICLNALICSMCSIKWSAVSLSSDNRRTKEDGPVVEFGIFLHQRTSLSVSRVTVLNSFCRLRRLHENLTNEQAFAVALEETCSSCVGVAERQAQSITRSMSSWGNEFTDFDNDDSVCIGSRETSHSLLLRTGRGG